MTRPKIFYKTEFKQANPIIFSLRLKIYIIIRLMLQGKYRCLYGCIRRRFIFYFAKRYFARQLSRKKGKCSTGGHCCNVLISFCPYLEDGNCSVYDKQPLFCRIFPIDEKDKELYGVKYLCGYHFE